jgi:hypothetical protein
MSEFNESVRVKNREDLKLKQHYWVYDPGMDEWNEGFEYMGYNELSNEHVFRYMNGPSNNCYFVMISDKDLSSEVCFDF